MKEKQKKNKVKKTKAKLRYIQSRVKTREEERNSQQTKRIPYRRKYDPGKKTGNTAPTKPSFPSQKKMKDREKKTKQKQE